DHADHVRLPEGGRPGLLHLRIARRRGVLRAIPAHVGTDHRPGATALVFGAQLLPGARVHARQLLPRRPPGQESSGCADGRVEGRGRDGKCPAAGNVEGGGLMADVTTNALRGIIKTLSDVVVPAIPADDPLAQQELKMVVRYLSFARERIDHLYARARYELGF